MIHRAPPVLKIGNLGIPANSFSLLFEKNQRSIHILAEMERQSGMGNFRSNTITNRLLDPVHNGLLNVVLA